MVRCIQFRTNTVSYSTLLCRHGYIIKLSDGSIDCPAERLTTPTQFQDPSPPFTVYLMLFHTPLHHRLFP